MFIRLINLSTSHRAVVATVLLLITFALGSGVPRLEVNSDLDSLVPSKDSAKFIYEQVSEKFGTDNRTVVYIRDKMLWTPDKLLQLVDLHRKLERLDTVARVDSLVNVQTIRSDGNKVDFYQLLSDIPVDREAALQLKANALANPLILNNLISKDGSVTALIVSVKEIDDDKQGNLNFYQSLENTLDPFKTKFEEVLQVGTPRINAELKENLDRDYRLLVPLSAFILIISSYLLLRSITAALIPLVTSIISVIWTFGMMGWVGMPLNILSVMLPSLLIVIGSTEGMHLIASYFNGLVEGDGNNRRPTAVRYMISHMGQPLLLTILTTALAFSTNIFSRADLVQNFALASTFAILSTGIIILLLVPLLLSFIGPLTYGESKRGFSTVSGIVKIITTTFIFVQQRFPRWILALTGILCLFFLYQASKIEVTNDPLSYFPEKRALIQDANKIHRDLAGVKMFYIILEAEQDEAFKYPDYINKLRNIQDFIKDQSVFDQTISLADHLLFIDRELGIGKGDEFPQLDSRELISQFHLFISDNNLESYVSPDFKTANIIVRHNVTDSQGLKDGIDELKHEIDKIAGVGLGLSTYIVGKDLMVNAAAENLHAEQVKSLGILLMAIFLIVSLMFTSFRGGVIGLVPVAFPIIIVFGIMGMLEISLNPGTAMIAIIAVGSGIGGTMHFLSRYNFLSRRTADSQLAVTETVKEQATPLIVSSLSLAAGFMVLLFSNFTVIVQFGIIATAAMLFSMYANLLLTPILVSYVRLVGIYEILGMSAHKEVLDNSPLFQNMTIYQRRKAVLISELHEYQEGEVIIQQGSVGRSMYLILSGEVEVILRSDDGSVRLATRKPGQILGEISYIRETKRVADVIAMEPVSVLRFDFEKMQEDLKLFPHIIAKMNFNICYILGEKLAETTKVKAESEIVK